jgi:cytidylate kinase
VIAIDGQAGSGKSTISGLLGAHFDVPVLNTGLYFRAAAVWFVRQGVEDVSWLIAQEDPIGGVEIGVEGEHAYLEGEEISEFLRTDAVMALLPRVSAHPGVRRALLILQREWAKEKGTVVVEGRDIGTVVFPHAFFKAFLVASDEARMARRPGEGAALLARDAIDSTRTHAPSVAAHDALLIDTTNLSIDEVVEQMIELVEYRIFELTAPR